MKREIVFRGKRVGGDGWAYGSYHYSKDLKHHYILNLEKFLYGDEQVAIWKEEIATIYPETVGQFTEQVFKGVELFEGDILGGDPHGKVWIEFDTEWGCWAAAWNEDAEDEATGEIYTLKRTSLLANEIKNCGDEWEVIGNIYENANILT